MLRNYLKLPIFIVTITTFSGSSTAQQANKVVVPLGINQDATQFSAQLIASRKNLEKLVYTSPVSDGFGKAPGGTFVRIQQDDEAMHSYKVWVDSDGDRTLDNDAPQLIAPNSSIVVKVNRNLFDGRTLTLPYTINYSREPDQSGQPRERFSWASHYRAEGKLKVTTCTAMIALLDLTSDGHFNSADSSLGTNIGIDRNNDGRLWGAKEFSTGNEIVEFCGESFLVESFTADGSSITLVRTELRVPKVGAALPSFSLTTVDGTRLESKNFRNKIYLLDFWASWCKPCVEKFKLVKSLDEEFKKDLSIIAINVDEKSQLNMARQIIKDYDLRWPHVMDGLGEADPLWKMFGTIGQNHLNIPLYVLVDAQGRFTYAGNGGEGLLDLRKEIERLVEKK